MPLTRKEGNSVGRAYRDMGVKGIATRRLNLKACHIRLKRMDSMLSMGGPLAKIYSTAIKK